VLACDFSFPIQTAMKSRNIIINSGSKSQSLLFISRLSYSAFFMGHINLHQVPLGDTVVVIIYACIAAIMDNDMILIINTQLKMRQIRIEKEEEGSSSKFIGKKKDSKIDK
jgi:hypothetical protein